MSRYIFLASDIQLPEVDFSGVIKMTLKEMKEMNPRPQSFWNLDEFADDSEVLFFPDNHEGGPVISLCSNPPDGLEQYIKRDYIYWLNGNFCVNKGASQFIDYLHSNIIDGKDVELWSLWIGGDGIESGAHHDRNLAQVNGELLKLLYDTDCCIHITK